MYKDYITKEEYDGAMHQAIPHVASVLNKLANSEAPPIDLLMYCVNLSVAMTCSILTNGLALLNIDEKPRTEQRLELTEDLIKKICSELLERTNHVADVVKRLQENIENDNFSDVETEHATVSVNTMDH